MKRYYYDFVVGDFDMSEQTYRHFGDKGLDESGITELENRIMKANPNCAYCKYTGEGYTN